MQQIKGPESYLGQDALDGGHNEACPTRRIGAWWKGVGVLEDVFFNLRGVGFIPLFERNGVTGELARSLAGHFFDVAPSGSPVEVLSNTLDLDETE